MRVIWSPTTQYRGFFSSLSQRVTLVSSNLAEEVVGRSVSSGLTIVTDDSGCFCDLDLELLSENRMFNPLLPKAKKRDLGQLATNFEPSCQARWFLESGCLFVSLTEERVEKWFKLGSSSLIIGIRSTEILSAVVFQGLIEDGNGSLEAAWLDEIESMET